MNINEGLDMNINHTYLQKVKEKTAEIAEKEAQIRKLQNDIEAAVDDIIGASSHIQGIVNDYQMDVYEIYDDTGGFLHGNGTVVFSDRKLAEESIRVNKYKNAKIRVLNGADDDTDFEFFNRVYTYDGAI